MTTRLFKIRLYNNENISLDVAVLLRLSTDLVYIHDLKGYFIDANDYALEVLGYSRIEIQKIKFSNLLPEDQINEALKIMKEIYETGKQKTRSIYKLKIKNGKEIYVSTFGIPLKKEGEIYGILSVGQDITDSYGAQQKLKESLKESEERYMTFFNNSPLSIILVDIRGQMLDCNPVLLKTYGYNKENLCGKNFRDVIKLSPEFLPIVLNAFKSLLNGEIQEPIEIQVFTKNGDLIWVKLYTSIVNIGGNKAIQVVSENISNAKKATQQLKESEIMFRNLFEHSPLAIALMDANGIFIDCNPIAEKLFGYNKSEIIGKHFQSIAEYPKESLPKVISNFKSLLSGKATDPLELKFFRKDGSFLHVILYSAIIKIGQKSIYQFIVQDMTKIKESEQVIRESEENYRSFFENAQEGIWALDKDSNTSFVNQKMADILGYTVNEMIGRHLFSFMNEEGVKDAKINLDRRQQGIKEDHDFTFVRKDGTRVYTRLATTPLIDAQGKYNGALAYIADITSQKIVEQQLRESEEKYRLLYDTSPVGIGIADLSGKVLSMNKKMLEITGFNINEINEVGLANTYVHPTDHQKLMNTLTESGKVQNYEVEYKKKDGTPFTCLLNIILIDLEGKRVLFSILQDITRLKKTEQNLKVSEEKYRLISENINDFIAILDSKLVYEYVNESTTRNLMGYSREDIVGKHAMNFIHPEDLKQAITIWNETFKVGEGAHTLRFKHKDGHWVWLEVRGKTFIDKNGERKGLTVSRDVTERKEVDELKEQFTEMLEKEVEIRTKELNNAIEKQNLLIDNLLKSSQFKSMFMATMSHELRTPLNGILGFTELLLDLSYGPISTTQIDFLNDIHSSAQHLLDLINKVLDITTIESGQLELTIKELKLRPIIDQVKLSLYPLYSKKGLSFKVDISPQLNIIRADPIRLKEILTNLLDNAIKYTLKGQIDLIIQEDSDRWFFKVKDTGIGIDSKDYDLVFQDFKKIETPLISSSLGAGLGLSISKRLVNLHGGDIWVESELGKGSTFYFTIPKKRITSDDSKL